MVEILEIPWFADKKRILRQIRTKARGCGFPDCWPLREPIKVNEKIYLRSKDLEKKKGGKVQVRRVLYNLEYHNLPLKRITMVCGNEKCCNPAHMRIRGWEEEANEQIVSQIEKGWLRPEDAEKWFDWKNETHIKIPDNFEVGIGSLGD
jgi:hypothetical protein